MKDLKKYRFPTESHGGVASAKLVEDKSVFDLVDVPYHFVKRDQTILLKTYRKGIPAWNRSYVYSMNELRLAPEEVKDFYKEFRDCFLKGVYYDIGENTHYAFALLFDLLALYTIHQNLSHLENQLYVLAKCYPKVASSAEKELVKRARERDWSKYPTERDPLTLSQLVELYPHSRQWHFSDRYGQKLALTPTEAGILDFIDGKYVSLSTVESVKLREVALFRAVLRQLDAIYRSRSTTTYREFARVARSFSMLKYGADHYYTAGTEEADLDHKTREIYNVVFRLGKNALYESWEVEDKVDPYNSVQHSVGKSLVRQEVTPVAEPVIREEVSKLSPLTFVEERVLNRIYPDRWKKLYKEIKERCGDDQSCYIEETLELIRRNEHNPGIRTLLFDMAKLLAVVNPEESLRMYLRYVRIGRDYPEYKMKVLPQYITKKLFQMSGSQERFEKVLERFKKDGHWEKALEGVTRVFHIPRKKLELNKRRIRKVESRHLDTVELLNEVLDEEHPDQSSRYSANEEKTDALPEVVSAPETVPEGSLIQQEPVKENNHSLFDRTQLQLLRLFADNHFSLSRNQLESFARSKGLFANQVVEKLNEISYDLLDDLLIEEEGDEWTISEMYFNMVMNDENKY